MSETRAPATTVEALDELDQPEIADGYWDGYRGEPEPGNNRSRAYWHGWRNGAVDGGHRPIDQAQRALAKAVLARPKRSKAAEVAASVPGRPKEPPK